MGADAVVFSTLLACGSEMDVYEQGEILCVNARKVCG